MAERLSAAVAGGGKAVALMGNAHIAQPEKLSYRLYWLPIGADM